MDATAFRQLVYEHFYTANRDFPWRHTDNPYHIWVSELMLQQTQAGRVVPKYQAFLEQFPTVESLASASTAEVLTAWKGLGYNRRALNLHRSAQQIVSAGQGFPTTLDGWLALPGIGSYTAAAIMTFAYKSPQMVIETNIRRVFLHHFFPDQLAVHDRELIPLIEAMLDRDQPHIWNWALMDYGNHLGATLPNANARSRHYTKQSTFEGSDRQLRGKVLEVLIRGALPELRIAEEISADPERLAPIIQAMEKEGFLERNDGTIQLVGG